MFRLADNGRVRRFESRHWAWWYLCIGLCFLLLAIAPLLKGAGLPVVGLRLGVAGVSGATTKPY